MAGETSLLGSSVLGGRWRGRCAERGLSSLQQEGSVGPGRCLPVPFRCHVSGRPGICQCYSPQQPRPGPQPRSLILSPRSGSVLIQMPSLQPWPRSGRLPEKPRPFPQPQATKAIFQPLSVHSKLKGRCFNPSRGRKREENAKGPVQVPKRVSAASPAQSTPCSREQALPHAVASPGFLRWQ